VAAGFQYNRDQRPGPRSRQRLQLNADTLGRLAKQLIRNRHLVFSITTALSVIISLAAAFGIARKTPGALGPVAGGLAVYAFVLFGCCLIWSRHRFGLVLTVSTLIALIPTVQVWRLLYLVELYPPLRLRFWPQAYFHMELFPGTAIWLNSQIQPVVLGINLTPIALLLLLLIPDPKLSEISQGNANSVNADRSHE
jgi:hypothetical protein